MIDIIDIIEYGGVVVGVSILILACILVMGFGEEYEEKKTWKYRVYSFFIRSKE